MTDQSKTTDMVLSLSSGNAAAADELFPLVYEELRDHATALMRRERQGHTLQATAVVNEVYLRLVDQDRVDWRGKTHFRAVASMVMGRFLREYARHHNREKRGGKRQRVTLHDDLGASINTDVDLLSLNDALEELERADDRKFRIVELKFLGGLTNEEVAEALVISTRSVERDWRFARAWLYAKLQ